LIVVVNATKKRKKQSTGVQRSQRQHQTRKSDVFSEPKIEPALDPTSTTIDMGVQNVVKFLIDHVVVEDARDRLGMRQHVICIHSW
jgi:hypothetical protein